MKEKTRHTAIKNGGASKSGASVHYPINIRETELKNKVAADWFSGFDTTKEIGNIDFCVAAPETQLKLLEAESILWAEAKKGNREDIRESFIQLILTLGKERPFDRYLPPKFIGAFDAEKIAFIPYHEIMDVFGKNDFNWNVTPSNHDTKEFKELDALIGEKLGDSATMFNWSQDEKELRTFIKSNFKIGDEGVRQIQITKNNFTHIYSKWRESVMPQIDIPDWSAAKKNGIIDADFFLADILSSSENIGLLSRLNVLLQSDHYRKASGSDSIGLPLFSNIGFKDGQKAHRRFWNVYKRPPKREYWDYIVNRRDLLVPQDVRERKGSFFTPKKWVELSQHYLEMALGENWQDEYYVWDCCAGTGNLLAGLTNRHRVWASTLDMQDVAVMKQRIANGANLLDAHVFQFDFLNDPLDSEKVPEDLRDVLNDEEKRKRLVIYINPPYAEHANRRVIIGTGSHRANVAKESVVYKLFAPKMGTATRELYVQFFLRIYASIPNAILASFSTMKFVCSQNCTRFRSYWKTKYSRGFICPSNTFDNVNGEFPIAFTIWRLERGEEVKGIQTDVVDKTGHLIGRRDFHSSVAGSMISDWLRHFYDKTNTGIAYMALPGVSMQQQNGVYITSKPTESDITQHKVALITRCNLMPFVVYLATRHCIEPTWENNKDEFLRPNDGWAADMEFQSDSLVWALFDNVIKSADGVNHWIPFTEKEVNAQGLFKSHFMSDFLAGKIKLDESSQGDLFGNAAATESKPFAFSKEAQAVMDAGRELWRYYHARPNANPNASYYDIRLHFQGSSTDAKGKVRMNSDSSDAKYTERLADLRTAMKDLARRIEPKVYEYGFLKK